MLLEPSLLQTSAICGLPASPSWAWLFEFICLSQLEPTLNCFRLAIASVRTVALPFVGWLRALRYGTHFWRRSECHATEHVLYSGCQHSTSDCCACCSDTMCSRLITFLRFTFIVTDCCQINNDCRSVSATGGALLQSSPKLGEPFCLLCWNSDEHCCKETICLKPSMQSNC